MFLCFIRNYQNKLTSFLNTPKSKNYSYNLEGFFFSFVQSHTCSFSLSILRTSSYYIIIFLPHFYHFHQAAIAIKISNSLICLCSFDLSCPILEKDIFIENLYVVLSCLIY